jgi:hypothetical protein
MIEPGRSFAMPKISFAPTQTLSSSDMGKLGSSFQNQLFKGA